MNAKDYLKKATVDVWEEKFAVVKAKGSMRGAFAVIKDKNETTAIIEESKVEKKKAIKTEKGWKMLTFDVVLPFGLAGFLAAVSKELAEEKISIFAVSAYSTDHIMIKEKNLEKALKRMKKLGCKIKTS